MDIATDTVQAKAKSLSSLNFADLSLAVRVRNEVGAVAFRAHLTLALDWPDGSVSRG
ncbi:hypothetical protein [Methylobacterium sp. J-077]|uniref:hypothetical protein n=1 Tax=Methylobacterium sp. J-077 TaxID=2836656 RepID=UPI001FBC010F|nr:hypothetical protein [Methylobacterium sp. J-077]MCJ2126043.1 hypothetical protein [Methylobacterium sp. J-077]